MTTPLGEKIRILRKNKGLTLEKLAEKAGSSKSYIWELENKNPPRPSAEKIAAIARELGVTSEFLIDTKAAQPTNSVIDEAFYRNYKDLPEPTKTRIRELVEIWRKSKE